MSRRRVAAPVRAASRSAARSAVALTRDYVALTKPRIISLLLLTTVATMFVADPAGPPLSTILWTMLGGYLAAGGAGAINHYIDRDRDARMARTRGRPLVAGRIEPLHGLVFGIVLGTLAMVELALTVNVLAAVLALARAARLRLRLHAVAEAADAAEHRHRRRRRRRPAAGRLGRGDRRPPLEALYPFGIVFLWTPPHFWALSLLIKDDYAAHRGPDAAGGSRRGWSPGARSSSTR